MENEAEIKSSDEELLKKAEQYIAENDEVRAQEALDGVKYDSGRCCFLQSEVFRLKKWTNEQRKQLERALNFEPDNEEYKKAMEELNDFKKHGKQSGSVKRERRDMFDVCDSCCNGFCDICSPPSCRIGRF